MTKRISAVEAYKLLPKGGDTVHVLRQIGPILIGQYFDRVILNEIIYNYEDTLRLSGNIASQMGYGMCLTDDNGELFIQTSENLFEIFKNW
jgi:hypothetical protein